MASKNPGGRPRKIKSPAEFVKLAQEYFDICSASKVLPNVTGLALAVGLSGKEALWNYRDREGFLDPIKQAKAQCEQALIEWTAAGKIPPALGIFMLKNHGWSDRHVLSHEGEIRHAGVAAVPAVSTADEWRERYGEHAGQNGKAESPEIN